MADHANHADFTANPAPLGLLGFGMTTVLLNLHNAGLFGMSSMILAMGILLRRYRPGDRRHHGVEEGQHLRYRRLHLLRFLLDGAGRSGQLPEDRPDGSHHERWSGRLPRDVGHLHRNPVRRHPEAESRHPGHLRFAGGAVRAARAGRTPPATKPSATSPAGKASSAALRPCTRQPPRS